MPEDTAEGGALTGLVVVDFTRVVSGPYATQILGDLGADIIKVERIEGGDDARPYGVTGDNAMPGPTFIALNRNKRSIALDLKRPEGRDIVTRLLRSADVAIHNFRPGVMKRLGIDYESVSHENPRIVYCEITGYGDVGPQRETAANDLAIQSYSGLLGITGEAHGAPVRVPTPVADITAGLYATIGILAALQHREKSGRGQLVETNMLEGQINMMSYMFVDYWMNGVIPQRMGTGNRMGLPNQAFPTSDGWVCIVASNDRRWISCCKALECVELLTDPRFDTLVHRYQHREELVEVVSAASRKYTTEECLRRLREGGVPCSPVNLMPTIAADEQLAALGTIVSMEVPGRGTVKVVRSPLHMSATPVSERLSPPVMMGAQTDEILAGVGYTAEEIMALRADGLVAG